MKPSDIRIVRLEPMRVATFYGFSEIPEDDAHKQCIAWLKETGLFDHPDSYRHFGFDNPEPTPGSQNYGYEIWIPVQADQDVGENIETKEFSGGLYGVTRCESLSTISKDWKRLIAWQEASPFKPGVHQWLEELFTKSVSDEKDLRFDLYIPIVE